MIKLTGPQLKKELKYDDIFKCRDGSGYFMIRRSYFKEHMCNLDYFRFSIVNSCECLGIGVEFIDCGSKWSTSHCGPVKDHSHMWAKVKLSRI